MHDTSPSTLKAITVVMAHIMDTDGPPGGFADRVLDDATETLDEARDLAHGLANLCTYLVVKFSDASAQSPRDAINWIASNPPTF
jgi:hypothetical protein